MKKKNIIVILFITIIISILLPFIFKTKNATVNDTISVIAAITSSFASLVTLTIAIVLFNKFGIETPLLEKNTTIVFKFLEELKKSKLSINADSYVIMVLLYDPHISFINELSFSLNRYYKDKLIFSIEYNNSLSKLFEIASSPFMPKSISNKVDKLNCYVLEMDLANKDISKYAIVSDIEGIGSFTKFGKFNGNDITIFEFLNLIEDVKVEVVNWIKKNSKYSPDLNL